MYSSVFDGRLSVATAPAAEPVSLEAVKAHLRIDSDAEDALLTGLIAAARQHVEGETRRALIERTYDLVLDGFPRHGAPIEIPRPPLRSVTSVQYVDLSGTTQTWSSDEYTVDAPSGDDADFGRIVPDYLQRYPDTQRVPGAVTVRFVAGYGATEDSIPAGLRQGLLMALGHLYANRDRAMPMPEAVAETLAPFRAVRF